MISRRFVLQAGLATTTLVFVPRTGTVFAQGAYPQTEAVLRRAREAETAAHFQYVAFTRQAVADGYPGIAYLFTAFATAERIHGLNFEKVLAGMGVEATPVEERDHRIGTTKENLIKAATDELASVNMFYPGMLKELAAEAMGEAVRFATYAWNTEKLHLGILKSIERWTPKHFEAVARKIENETAQYLVCQVCGATMIKLPRSACPVCRFPPENIHRIEPPV
jgi:rubrerythrin